jgi:hypothetical protein
LLREALVVVVEENGPAAIAVAGVSAVYTKRLATSAARQAAEAEKVTAIEQKRFHADLTPFIALTCEAATRDGQQATLTLELTGPGALDGLDEVCGCGSAMTRRASRLPAYCRPRSTGMRRSGEIE